MVYDDRTRRSEQQGYVDQGQGHDDNCNSQKHRQTSAKGMTGQSFGGHKKNTETNDSDFRAELIQERVRRSAIKAEQNGEIELQDKLFPHGSRTPHTRETCESDQYLIQMEDLERMRLNKSHLHNMKNSICALTKLTEGLGKDISDVTAQHKAATSLWKDLKTKFKEINKSLNSDNPMNRAKTINVLKNSLQNISTGSSLEAERMPQKLVLPKIDTGSRPNSTPSILQMQIAQQQEENEIVNTSKMSHIKKIARKRSQEKAKKDLDLHQSSTQAMSSCESLISNSVHKQKRKKENRQLDKTLHDVELEDKCSFKNIESSKCVLGSRTRRDDKIAKYVADKHSRHCRKD